MNSGWRSLDLSPLLEDAFLNSKRAPVGRHFNVAPALDIGTPDGVLLLPPLRVVLTRRNSKLRRGLVELFLFILSWAGFHARSIA